MITAGTGVGQSFTLNINGIENTYTTNGVVYNSVVEMKTNQTISLTSNGVSSMYQGASLVVTLE